MGPFWHGSYRCYALVGPPGGPRSDATESHEDCRRRTIRAGMSGYATVRRFSKLAEMMLLSRCRGCQRSFISAVEYFDMDVLLHLFSCLSFQSTSLENVFSKFKFTYRRHALFGHKISAHRGYRVGHRREKNNYRERYKHDRHRQCHIPYLVLLLISNELSED